MIEITLHGCWTARCAEYGLEITATDPISKICREILWHGGDPDELVHITRNGKEPFLKNSTVRTWASQRITEEAAGSLRKMEYRDHPKAKKKYEPLINT